MPRPSPQRRTLPFIAAFIGGGLVALAASTIDWGSVPGTSRVEANEALYRARDWGRASPSKLNMSVFTFSDRDRNGRYNLGDKPLTRIAVRLTRPDDSSRIIRSNVNGYANFSMQREGKEADITVLGREYRFEVLPPPGWEVTTGNALQRSAFMAVPGSIAGMGAQEPPATVGLTPPATISGRWPEHAGDRLMLRSDDGQELSTRLDGGGRFRVDATPGRWRLTDEDGRETFVELAYAPVVVGAPPKTAATANGAPAAAAAAPRRRRVIGFDDLQRSFIEKIAAGYGGLAWEYLLAVENQFYKGPGYINGLASGARVAYNSSGHPVTISALEDGQSFDFISGLFSVAWHNAEGETLRIRAYRRDTLIATNDLRLSHLSPVLFYAGYRNVDRVTLETAHYWQFVLDDLVVALDDASP